MTAPQSPYTPNITAAPTIHKPAPQVNGINRLTPQQVGAIGTVIVDLILAAIARAIGGISFDFAVLGYRFHFAPFNWLNGWAATLERQAQQAYLNAFAAIDVTKGQPVGTTTQAPAVDVYNATAAIYNKANVGATGAAINGANIQSTWNAIVNGTIVGGGGVGGGTAASYSDVQAAVTGVTADASVNPVDSSRIPVVPAAHITADSPNLVIDGSFDTVATVASGISGWSWDGTKDRTATDGSSGSVVAVANASSRTLNKNFIPVSYGDTLIFSGYLNWSSISVSSTTATAFALNAVFYLDGSVVSTTPVATYKNPASSSGWQQITGSVDVPTGVQAAVMQLQVTAVVVSGRVWFDDLVATKTGTISGDLVGGISPTTTIAADVQTAANAVYAGFRGQANLTGNISLPDVQATGIATNRAIAENSAAIVALQTTPATGKTSVFVDFTKQADASSLGSSFTQSYSGSGGGTLGITSGRATWQQGGTLAPRFGFALYNAAQTQTDYQKVGAAFSSAPTIDGSGSPPAGSTWVTAASPAYGHNYLFGRMNSATTRYVFVDFTATNVALYYYNGSGNTLLAQTSHTFQAGSTYYLACGIPGSVNTYQVLIGSAALISYVDSASTILTGSAYRYSGLQFYFDTTTGRYSTTTATPPKIARQPWTYTTTYTDVRYYGYPGSMSGFTLLDNN